MNEENVDLSALTVRQPWASLIINGIKDVENRSWRSTDIIGRRLVIHAGITVDHSAFRDRTVISSLFGGMTIGDAARGLRTVPYGAALGTVTVADIVRDSTSRWAESGSWHWVLRDPERWEQAIPFRGKQGLWRFDGRIVQV